MKPDSIYKEIIESSSQGICVFDDNFKITFLNKSAHSILGCNPGEMIYKSVYDLPVTEDCQVFRKHLEDGRKGKSGCIDIRIKKEGTHKKISFTSNPRLDENGNYSGGFAIITEISGSESLTENIKRHDEIIKTFFYNNPNAMWIYDIETLDFLEANNAAQLIYGYSREEFLSMKVTSIRTPDDISKLKYYLERTHNKSLRSLFNIKHKYKDGTVVYVDLINNDVTYMGRKACLATISSATSRVKMQDALEKSEIRYRTLFESAGSGIVYCDREGKIILINEICAKYLNSSPEKLRGKNISRILPKTIAGSIKQTLAEVVAQKRYTEREDNIGTLEKPAYFLANFQPLLDLNNEVYGVQLIIYDITERKKSEKVLRESEARFRHLFEDMEQIPVQGYNTNHEIIFWNNASEIVYGYTKEEAIGAKIEELIIPDNLKEEVYNAIENFCTKGIQIPSGEIKLKKKDGTIVTMFSSHVIINNFNGKKEMYCVDVDMSQRVEAERKIAFQATMLDAVGQSVFVVDKTGNIIFINDAAEKLFGWKKNEILNKNFLSILVLGDLRKQAEDILNIVKKGETWSGEFQIKNRSGMLFPIYTTNSPIYDSSNDLAGIICVAVDITDLKHKERELKAAKEKAEEMNRMKSAFLTNMSHELRTPLVGILGFSEILNEEVNSDIHKNIANSILFSGKRLLSTLNAILDLSKIEADTMAVNYSEFAVISEIKSLLKVFDILASKKGLKLDLDYDGKDFIVELDKNIFLQIIENLVHNALKFTESGKVEIAVKREIDSFTIKVKDTGIGIPAESQELIFQEFRQLSEGYGRHFDGSGIGLTLTKSFVQLLNGIIYVESRPNEGSTFSVCFPLSRNRNSFHNYTIH